MSSFLAMSEDLFLDINITNDDEEVLEASSTAAPPPRQPAQPSQHFKVSPFLLLAPPMPSPPLALPVGITIGQSSIEQQHDLIPWSIKGHPKTLKCLKKQIPKKPTTPFLTWSKEQRDIDGFVKHHPSPARNGAALKAFNDIQKQLGEKWKSQPSVVKETYVAKFKRGQEQYRHDIRRYNEEFTKLEKAIEDADNLAAASMPQRINLKRARNRAAATVKSETPYYHFEKSFFQNDNFPDLFKALKAKIGTKLSDEKDQKKQARLLWSLMGAEEKRPYVEKADVWTKRRKVRIDKKISNFERNESSKKYPAGQLAATLAAGRSTDTTHANQFLQLNFDTFLATQPSTSTSVQEQTDPSITAVLRPGVVGGESRSDVAEILSTVDLLDATVCTPQPDITDKAWHDSPAMNAAESYPHCLPPHGILDDVSRGHPGPSSAHSVPMCGQTKQTLLSLPSLTSVLCPVSATMVDDLRGFASPQVMNNSAARSAAQTVFLNNVLQVPNS